MLSGLESPKPNHYAKDRAMATESSSAEPMIDRRTMLVGAGVFAASGTLLAATKGLAAPPAVQQMIPATVTSRYSGRVADIVPLGARTDLTVETTSDAFVVHDGRSRADLFDYADGELIMVEINGPLPPGKELGHGDPSRRSSGKVAIKMAVPMYLGDASDLAGRR